jgi:hypothetical protein
MNDAGPSAGELLRALRRLHAEGRVALTTDAGRLKDIDSPVVVEADTNIWLYAGMAAALGAWGRWGGTAALGAAALGAAAYATLGRRYVRRRLERRVREEALLDLERWRKLWRFGGVSLSAPGLPDCRAPEGNWMEFVRRLGA